MTSLKVSLAGAPVARADLEMILRRESQVEMVGSAPAADLVFAEVRRDDTAAWQTAATVTASGAPDLALLPEKDPRLIRACDRYGVRYAFSPLTSSGVRSILRTAHERLAAESPADRRKRIAAFLEEARRQPAYAERLAIRTRGARSVLRIDEIDWIESAANYVHVHAGGASHVVRATINEIEATLDPRRFSRIHRCRLVNVERIREYRSVANGRFELVLADGTTLEMSRGNRRKFPLLASARGTGA
ncbi:MAG TPA: LytTR family DNA-binding domain-containing protein [Verrucomicrobiae bacterium]|nr:LytTR family DNA-binding domain-containing protein [Verrucomicrobiae bacterium]